MSSAWENCAESCNLIFAPTLSVQFGAILGLIGTFLRLIVQDNEKTLNA